MCNKCCYFLVCNFLIYFIMLAKGIIKLWHVFFGGGGVVIPGLGLSPYMKSFIVNSSFTCLWCFLFLTHRWIDSSSNHKLWWEGYTVTEVPNIMIITSKVNHYSSSIQSQRWNKNDNCSLPDSIWKQVIIILHSIFPVFIREILKLYISQ